MISAFKGAELPEATTKVVGGVPTLPPGQVIMPPGALASPSPKTPAPQRPIPLGPARTSRPRASC
jgi:hypothetical protein